MQNCHPPASVHIVNGIVGDLTLRKKNYEDFWLRIGEKYVYIRYFAVSNERGEYLGTMEVTQAFSCCRESRAKKDLWSLGTTKVEFSERLIFRIA
ncbi:PAS domain protein [Acididesulfobacillus acetoxydans]|uniref:PAS domain n=1 Tax=Acididesulfobacillus acetoxydans TaxID=1561005 RepID=A0A8S0XAW2_9FIRM|nr:PAS domain protein [Acididesulfobacillus acetoxydans]CEJ06600.1 PAS domain [Acididesulfobacillus acetoxydans]